tara:strand:+ start:1122 stop:1802 length:681 start_codon:yes stop_codon:yes gene_type:complete
MDKNKIISVIVPVFNEENFLPEVINQLMSWCESEDEIIVSDGGSSDGTVNLCDRVRLVRTKKGRAIQMNEAAKCAKGDVLWFLHADVGISNISRSELLSVGREKFWGFFDIDLKDSYWIFRIIESCMNFRSRLTKIATGDKGIFLSRQVFEEIGGFPEIEIMEDIAISKKLKLYPPYISSHRLQVSSRRWKKNGILRTVLLMWFLRLAWFFKVSASSLERIYTKHD